MHSDRLWNSLDFGIWRSDTLKSASAIDKMSSDVKIRTGAGLILACALVMPGQAAPTGEAGVLLTNAADVISLPVERAARQIKVLVTGTVTATVPTLGGSFFVQDATSGVFVDNRNGPLPQAGDVVRVSGFTEKGAYAPVITGPTYLKVGTAPLPPAQEVSIE